MGRQITCAMCNQDFTSSWSEAEALAELKENFPGVPKEDCATVCDTCWNEPTFKAWREANPFGG